MLYVYGFNDIGVVVGDLYFHDPNLGPDQEGPEQGVRLEIRLLQRTELRGSRYSAQPIAIEAPIWRADLLESVDRPGTLDRAHHHPRFRGWDPGRRTFVEAMSGDPVGWVGDRLAAPEGILEEAGVDLKDFDTEDLAAMAAAAPEIVDAVKRLLDGVRAGDLAKPTDERNDGVIRSGWL
jgi:hypothetical protein